VLLAQLSPAPNSQPSASSIPPSHSKCPGSQTQVDVPTGISVVLVKQVATVYLVFGIVVALQFEVDVASQAISPKQL